MVATTRGNIHATVVSITWNPHHRSVEYPKLVPCSIDNRWRVQTPSNVPIERSQRDLPTPPLSLNMPPPLFRTKASQNLPHDVRYIMCRYEGSTCPLKKTPFKRPGKVFSWVLVNYISKFEVLFFSRPKIEPSSALSFLVFLMFRKNRM